MKIQKNVDKMHINKGDEERKQRKKRQKTAGIILAAIFFLLWGANKWYGRWEENHSGIPDAVSSRIENRECFLDVIANTDKIENTQDFARTVIRMCRENSFRSIHLSTDLYGYPERLEINVYLHREDVNRVEPVQRIRYEPPESAMKGDSETEYNIKDHAEKYKLYVDGNEIPCYY